MEKKTLKETLKRVLAAAYFALILVMIGATVVEKFRGTTFTHQTIYGAWWFAALWAVVALAGLWLVLRRPLRRGVPFWLVHAALALILVGALTTHLTAQRGMVHLRQGETTNVLLRQLDNGAVQQDTLPFRLQLVQFAQDFHAGTAAVEDYQTHFRIIDPERGTLDAAVSMNKIATHRHFRLMQLSYDSDGQGSVLSVTRDVWGIGITYFAYALLFLGLILMLFVPGGRFRTLLKSPALRRLSLALAVLLLPASAAAQRTVPSGVADAFSRIYVNYGERICPMQTYSQDFLRKLSGSATYNGLSATQVLLGFVFYPAEWNLQPVISIDSRALRSELGMPKHVAYADFLDAQKPAVKRFAELVMDWQSGSNDPLPKAAGKLHERLLLILMLQSGEPLRIFPCKGQSGAVEWLSPTSELPADAPEETARLQQLLFPMLTETLAANQADTAALVLQRMHAWQRREGGIASELPARCERIYNSLPLPTILFMANLTLALLAFFVTIAAMTTQNPARLKRLRRVLRLFYALLLLSLLALTAYIALRWVAKGTIPVANGYETTLVTAWALLLIGAITAPRIALLVPFSLLLSGFFLLVSHINQLDPQITHQMPVLNSPLLSVHVSVIMIAYALLSLTAINSLTALTLSAFRRKNADSSAEKSFLQLSQLLLYPAIATLAIGIFIGAIWANVSWGQYWSWDPKETWALITLMVYAVPLHLQWFAPRFVRQKRFPAAYHAYMLLAFLVLLFTYFGVNYLLSGMHSYA